MTMRRDGDGAFVCTCALADTFWTRARGLLGRRSLAATEGLLIRPARSVHMIGMRFGIDAVFLGADGDIRGIVAGLRPWRLAGCRAARQVLELSAGRAATVGLRIGQRLELTGSGT